MARILILLALWLLGAFAVESQNWPRFRGPNQDGVLIANQVPSTAFLGLEVVWKRPLGSGYSGISVAGDKGVTLFSDGEHDFVTTFDTATGEELWRRQVGTTYRGHDGSSDGPLSTPAIAGDMVFALGPRGLLLALEMSGGTTIWSYQLTGDAPMYGYTSAPLVMENQVIVQTGGGPGRSLTAFDRDSGKIRWTSGDDSVSYQSPAVLEFLGKRQVVAVSDFFVAGIEPATGHILWRHRHTEDGENRGSSGLPLKIADDRLLIRPSSNDAALFELTRDEAGDVTLRELWRARLNRSHSATVLHGDHLFSFDTHFLTALDAGTGKRTWKSRPPGGRGLIVVDGYLVVLGAKGHVVLAEASPDGYREAARLRVFEHDGWTPPSFAGGHVLVRNLEEMASLRITAADDGELATSELTARHPLRGRLGQRLSRIAAAPEAERQTLVDELLAAQTSFPVVEDGGLVHFLYRGNADDVAIAGNLTEGFGEEVSLSRLPGTDLFFAAYDLDPRSHYEYRFHVNFGGPMADPRNPHAIGSIFGPSSELRMPGWRVPEHLQSAAQKNSGSRGRVVDAGGKQRPFRVYLPPGYDDSEQRYPLLVVQEGEGGESAHLEQTLDRLIGSSVAPMVAVFLPPLKHEHDNDAMMAYTRWVTEELIPGLDRTYRTFARPERRGILGAGSGAAVSAYVVFKTPGIFNKVALQSFFLKGLFGKLGAGAFSLTPEAQEKLLTLIREGERQQLDIYAEWSVRESVDPASGLDVEADTKRFLETLEILGYGVRKNEVMGAPGYGSWRARNDLILEMFFSVTP